MKENGLTLKKKNKKKTQEAETNTGADYADNLALLTNTPAQAECLLYINIYTNR